MSQEPTPKPKVAITGISHPDGMTIPPGFLAPGMTLTLSRFEPEPASESVAECPKPAQPDLEFDDDNAFFRVDKKWLDQIGFHPGAHVLIPFRRSGRIQVINGSGLKVYPDSPVSGNNILGGKITVAHNPPYTPDPNPVQGQVPKTEIGDMLETAWGIIANAAGGDWDKCEAMNPGWTGAAQRWRDRYFSWIKTYNAFLDAERPATKQGDDFEDYMVNVRGWDPTLFERGLRIGGPVFANPETQAMFTGWNYRCAFDADNRKSEADPVSRTADLHVPPVDQAVKDLIEELKSRDRLLASIVSRLFRHEDGFRAPSPDIMIRIAHLTDMEHGFASLLGTLPGFLDKADWIVDELIGRSPQGGIVLNEAVDFKTGIRISREEVGRGIKRFGHPVRSEPVPIGQIPTLHLGGQETEESMADKAQAYVMANTMPCADRNPGGSPVQEQEPGACAEASKEPGQDWVPLMPHEIESLKRPDTVVFVLRDCGKPLSELQEKLFNKFIERSREDGKLDFLFPDDE